MIINHDLGLVNNNYFASKYPKYQFYRYYYIFRNGIYLALYNKEISIPWRINIFFNIIKYFFGFLMIEKFNFKIVTIFFQSFYDAYDKILGKSNRFKDV